MKYRLGFPLVIIAVIACIGIACAMGRNVLPNTILDVFNASAPSGGQADVADLSKRQPSSQGGTSSAGGSGGETDLSAGAFEDFFEVAQTGEFSEVTASLTFPQDSEYNGAHRGVASALGYSSFSSGFSGASGFSGSFGSSGSSSRGGRTGPVWKLGSSSGAGSGGSSGSGGGAGSGSFGGSGGGNTSSLPQNQVLASLITGQKDSGSGGSTPNPVSVDDSGSLPKVTDIPQTSNVPQQSNPAGGGDPGILPSVTEIPQTPFVPQLPNPAGGGGPGILPSVTEIPQTPIGPAQVDPLLGAPLRDVVPGPDERTPDPAPVPNPEPGTLILGGLGLAIMAVARRRMKSRQGE